MDGYQLPLLTAAAGCIGFYIWRYRSRAISLKDIRGPDGSPGKGGQHQLEAGELDFQWRREYGGVARVKGPFGEDRLWVADIKALHYIHNGYNFAKEPSRREIARSFSGRGVMWANGETHRRQKRVVQPAFGVAETRGLMPTFRNCVERVTGKWNDLLTGTGESQTVVNINDWLTRVALDAIGEAGFGTHFGAVDDAENEFVRTYHNLVASSFGVPNKMKALIIASSSYLPHWLLDFMYDYLPGEGLALARENRKVATKASKDLVESKIQENKDGKSGRDILTLLVNANKSFDNANKLSDDELVAQMRTFIIAGHETTAHTLTFAFLELAKNPDIQKKLRDEIRATRAAARARGDTDISSADYDGMAYLNAYIKEILRYHPVAFNILKKSVNDDVVPLANPITTVSGKVVNEVPVPSGTVILVSVAACNRDKSLWGEDADEFKPERWLKAQPRTGPTVGIFANMLSFSGGHRACLGYRFAVLEMQVFLVELINNFEFGMTEEASNVVRVPSFVMVAMIKGQEEKGVQMPLKIKPAPPEEDF